MSEVRRSLVVVAVCAVASIACTSGEDTGDTTSDGGEPDGPARGAGGAAASAGGNGGAANGGLAGEPHDAGGTRAAGGAAEGGRSSDGGAGGGAPAGTGGDRVVYPPGPPGCGFEHAAFCETFDAPAGVPTRAGELDPTKWSAARFCNIGGPSDNDEAVAIGPATMPACRPGLPSQVLPSADAVICDATESIHNNHLLVLAAAQNYGQNSYRIRQPFDFEGRTGTVVFDAEGHNVGLQGWVSIEITEDPAPAPSFTLQQNFENGSIPRNGIEIQLDQICGGDNVGILHLFVYDDYRQDLVLSDTGVCVPAGAGKLNRFRVEVSKTRIEVFGTPASDDGVTFGEAVLLGAKDVELPFTRGYVHVTTHNHASLKYSDGAVDAWTARWDNVGFDGPVIGRFREYEALDPLTPANGGKVNVGWRLADVANGPAQGIELRGVNVSGAVKARLALQNWSYHPAGSSAPGDYALDYRLNGHAWKHRPLTASELRMMTDLPNAGTRSLMLDVDVADLEDGTNIAEFTTTNAAPPLTPVVVNVDLILETE